MALALCSMMGAAQAVLMQKAAVIHPAVQRALARLRGIDHSQDRIDRIGCVGWNLAAVILLRKSRCSGLSRGYDRSDREVFVVHFTIATRSQTARGAIGRITGCGSRKLLGQEALLGGQLRLKFSREIPGAGFDRIGAYAGAVCILDIVAGIGAFKPLERQLPAILSR
ncbi:hypothetical protein [Blastomonas sp.]|uniref:hypothetical protein n=1 Tax=Blastomonas sp. TaxID=1909299 RepID=UPI00391D8A69